MAEERKVTAEEIFHETERLLLEAGYERNLHRILFIAHVVDTRGNKEIAGKLEHLGSLHQEMYKLLYVMVKKQRAS